MNKEQLQQKIAYYFEKLSPEAQAVFQKMEWLEKLQAIAHTYALNEDQIQTLGTETTLALLGIIHPDEFEKNLAEELHLPKLTLDRIVIEINDNILNPIRNDLYNAFDANVAASTPEELEIETKLDEKFNTLPENIQSTLLKSNYYNNLYLVAQEAKLTVSQMSALEECVTNVVVGKAEGAGLAAAIQKSAGLDPEASTQLANNINEKVLREIRKNMMAEKAPLLDKGGAGGGLDKEILESAGIKILNGEEKKVEIKKEETPDLTRPELPAGSASSTAVADRPAGHITPLDKGVGGLLSQKLAGTFKMDTAQSTHKSVPRTYQKGEDPYREPPK